jgi:hypothetical protein
MRTFCCSFLVFSFVSCGAAHGQVAVDDFLSPTKGGTKQIQAPDKVIVQKNTVTAASAQDAINAAIKANQSASGDDGSGCRMVTFPSGIGFVSTGRATYRVMDNATATRIAKRKAYVVAYVQAKKQLAETLGGLSSQSKETVRQALVNVNLPKEEMTNISTDNEEALRQTVDMMLRGFEIYDVNDDTKENTVSVSIVTTPKTRGRMARLGENAMQVSDTRQGLNQIIQEVLAGVVPPVGGRIVIARDTGETVLVGFGSMAVRTSKSDAVQAKLNLEMQKIAKMRAEDSLCGLLHGDRSTWEGRVVDRYRDATQEFEIVKKDDPLCKEKEADIKKLENARNEFLSKFASQEIYQSVRRGILPPGVVTKTWFDKDHEWAYAMSVYMPSAGRHARAAALEMEELGRKDASTGVGPSGSGFKDESNSNVKRPGATVKQGPSGKVGKDDDR